MKFDLSKFVMKTLQSMWTTGEDEYKIRQYALKYYERNVLTEENLSNIENWFVQDENNTEDNKINETDEKVTNIIN